MSILSFEDANMRIRCLVNEKLALNMPLEDIDDNLLFGTASGFDSTSLLEFILALEDHFDIIVPDEDLLPENFGTISKITEYVVNLKEE